MIIYWIYPPPRMPVTTRIIPFLVGNPYKPSFVTVTGWGVDRNYIHISKTNPSYGEQFGASFYVGAILRPRGGGKSHDVGDLCAIHGLPIYIYKKRSKKVNLNFSPMYFTPLPSIFHTQTFGDSTFILPPPHAPQVFENWKSWIGTAVPICGRGFRATFFWVGN